MYDGEYIEYLLDKRIMRRTKNPELLHNIYASKYAKWIKEYLNNNQIEDVPFFLACNTLYKLPDTFRIRNNSFFVGDYYLFDYFYDWNYVLSNCNYHEFVVNLCIKQYIESCFLNDKIDDAYLLCLTSDGLEDFKTESYYNQEVMAYFVNRTDIQEKFTMLHEAGHYLSRFVNKEVEIQQIKEIHDELIKVIKIDYFMGKKERDLDLERKLFEECYCDSQAVLYIVDHFDFDETIFKSEYYTLLLNTLFYIYILMYIDTICLTDDIDTEAYFDYQLWELTYRIGNIYNVLYAKLLEQGSITEIQLLKKVYTEFIHTFSIRMKEIREIVFYIKETLEENKSVIKDAFKVSDADRIQFIKDYLKLL